MGALKPREFYPDFHVNIRKDGRVNGIDPVTLKDMGLPYDLDYPEQPVDELSKELYENLVEEFIFLIDELLPRDIQDLFYKATLDPRRAYWKLFEEAARRMQLPYYLNCHRDKAKGYYPNIFAGIKNFVDEGRSLADIYLNTCLTKAMIFDVIDDPSFIEESAEDYSEDSGIDPLLAIEAALFKMSRYNYVLHESLPVGEGTADLVLYSRENNPELIVMEKPEEPSYEELWDDDVNLQEDYNDYLKERYKEKLQNLEKVEEYCGKNQISCLKISSREAIWEYEFGSLDEVIRKSIDDPEYAKTYGLNDDEDDEALEEYKDMDDRHEYPEGYLFDGTLKKIHIESDNLCYGPAPMPDDETLQILTIDSDGTVLLERHSYSEKLIERKDLKADTLRIKALLDTIALRFSKDPELHFITDIGTWDLTLTNEEGREFNYGGSMNEDAGSAIMGLSDHIRDIVGINDMFVFDGCPDKITDLKVEYDRETRIKPKELPEGATYEYLTWSYSEVLTIDRKTETLTNHIQFAEQCSVTNTYHVEAGISNLLDSLWPEMFDDNEGNPPDAIDDPMKKSSYKITVHTALGKEKVVEGSFDKRGLPSEWSEFIEKIYDFMNFYGIGELFDRGIYGKAKRTLSDYIFCNVEFESGGKTYCYLAEDDSYEVGDTVLVPAGHDNHEALVRIVDKNYYSKEDAPFPVEKAKWIIKRVDEDEIDDY